MADDPRGPYERAQQELAPRPLRRGDGDTWLGILGKNKDLVRRYMLDAMRNWFAGHIQTAQGPSQAAANDALQYIASNFDLERPEILTDDQFRQMILMAWAIWIASGTQAGLVREIERLGFGRVALLPVWKEARYDDGKGNYVVDLTYNTFEVEQNELFQLFYPPTNWYPEGIVDWRATEWDQVYVSKCYPPPYNVCVAFFQDYWDYFNYIWSAFYVVIGIHEFTFWAWGDDRQWGQADWGWDGVKTGDRVLLKRLLHTIRKFKAGHTSCRGVLFHFPTTVQKRYDTITVSKDINNQYSQAINTVVFPPFGPVSIWDAFNWGGNNKYGAGFCGVRMYEEWEVDDSRPANVGHQWGG